MPRCRLLFQTAGKLGTPVVECALEQRNNFRARFLDVFIDERGNRPGQRFAIDNRALFGDFGLVHW